MTDQDFDNEFSKKPIYGMLMKLPFSFEWVKFKGETFFAGVNYEATEKARKPMVDLFYCATTALNHKVLKTVQYDKKKFSPDGLAKSYTGSWSND